MTKFNAPNVAFIGICDRAIEIREGDPIFWKYNIIGLKKCIPSHIFPLPINNLRVGLAIYNALKIIKFKISIISPSDECVINLNYNAEIDIKPEITLPPEQISVLVPTGEPIWTFSVLNYSSENVLIKEPGNYKVILCQDNYEVQIGLLNFVHIPATPLTEDRIAAIQSDPNSARFVKMVLQCKLCSTRILCYSGIEHSTNLEKEGHVWYKNLPEKFICECGKSIINLNLIRNNMHGYLGSRIIGREEQDISFTKMYDRNSIDLIIYQYKHLLNKNSEEQEIQKFIESNSILLHQFAPQRIFYKKSILTKFKTDIAILNNKQELLLIELEKPAKKLLTQKGSISHQLQHAINQVDNWLHKSKEFYSAVLDAFYLKSEEVTRIEGIVIMGRDHTHNQDHLRQLKWKSMGDVTLYTYDDILKSLISLSENID